MLTNDIIKKSNVKHKNKYDYSFLSNNEYNLFDYIKIVCPKHGVFSQKLKYHIYGNGCKKCANEKISKSQKIGNTEYIKRVKVIHDNFYDYSKTKYIDGRKKVIITCPIHGDFEMIAKLHLYGSRCKKCVYDSYKCSFKLKKSDFINKARLIHKNLYSYDEVKYVDYFTKVKIKCKKHGFFYQKPREHLRGCGCRKCGSNTSKPEKEIFDFLKEIGIDDIEMNNKTILSGKEIDVFLPKHNIGIEYCGLYWHSNKFLDNNYHRDKTFNLYDKKIRGIFIFEDEWLFKNDIVKSKLKKILNDEKSSFEKNKYNIKKISKKDFSSFLNEYHVENCNYNLTVQYGLFFKNEILSVIGLNFKKNKNEWRIMCFASKISDTESFTMMLNFIINKYTPEKITAYADLRYTDISNNIYIKNGFKESRIIKPNYYYIKNNQKRYFKNDINLSNHSYNKVYDCGGIKYQIILNKEKM